MKSSGDCAFPENGIRYQSSSNCTIESMYLMQFHSSCPEALYSEEVCHGQALKFGERHELRCPIRASKEDQADSGSSTDDSKWSQVPMSEIHLFK